MARNDFIPDEFPDQPREKRGQALKEDPLPQELNFEETASEIRTGDLEPRSKVAAAFPPVRVREAGRTGGEVLDDSVDETITADDFAPENLLNDDPAEDPMRDGFFVPADQNLTIVNGRDAGLGEGLDEAEWADVDPVGKSGTETP
jgi:hypothetical protein